MTVDHNVEAATTRRRLTGGERTGFIFLTLVAIAVLLAGLGQAFVSSLHLFGQQPTPREGAISAQGLRIALWALATPVCARIVLRRRRAAWVAAAVWLALLLATTWWAWPSAPTEGFDSDKPLWLSSYPLLWALVAGGLAVGVYSARRAGGRRTLAVALGIALAIVALGGVSHARLLHRADAERPIRLAEGAAEIRALRADPVWEALPDDVGRDEREYQAERAVWGERFPTRKIVEYRSSDKAIFVRAIAAAESNGWTLSDAGCYVSYWSAVFTKALPVGDALLRISWESHLGSVHITGEFSQPPSRGRLSRCWTEWS